MSSSSVHVGRQDLGNMAGLTVEERLAYWEEWCKKNEMGTLPVTKEKLIRFTQEVVIPTEKKMNERLATKGEKPIKGSYLFILPVIDLREKMREASEQTRRASLLLAATTSASSTGTTASLNTTKSLDSASAPVAITSSSSSVSSSSKKVSAPAKAGKAKAAMSSDSSVELSSQESNAGTNDSASSTSKAKETKQPSKNRKDTDSSKDNTSTSEPATKPHSRQEKKNTREVLSAVVVPTKKSTKTSSPAAATSSTAVVKPDRTQGGSSLTGDNRYSRFKASEFSLPRRTAIRFEGDVSAIPKHHLKKEEVNTVLEALEEWRFGINGGPALQDLYLKYASHWQHPTDRNWYNARAGVVREYVRLVLEEKLSDEEAIKSLETRQGTRALHAFYLALCAESSASRKIKKKRSAESDDDEEEYQDQNQVQKGKGKDAKKENGDTKVKRQRKSSTKTASSSAADAADQD